MHTPSYISSGSKLYQEHYDYNYNIQYLTDKWHLVVPNIFLEILNTDTEDNGIVD